MKSASRTVRLLTVATLALGPGWVVPTATAATPPPLDNSRLPAAGPPRPPRPTEQYDDCAGTPTRAPAATVPGQLSGVDLPTVWALTRGAGQTVAVIDTGVARHRLLPHLIPGGDYVSNQDGAVDCDGHGTIIAGIIGAADDSEAVTGVGRPAGFTGIAPDVTVLAIRQSSSKFRALDESAGSGFGDVETLASAVRTAADLGATVINISSVACQPVDAELDDRALGAALAYAVDIKNVVVVTAAGNVGGPGQCPGQNPTGRIPAGRTGWDDVAVVVSPGWYDDYVLTVGSVDSNGAAAEFSLAGPWVDVAAPGEGIVSLAPAAEGLVDTGSNGAAISGTSYAAAVVSAIAALVRARSPELTARQVMQRIEDTARNPTGGWDATVGRGVVDALAAVSNPGPAGVRLPQKPKRQAASTAPTGERLPERSAIRGALLCFGLTAGIVVVSASMRRLRRRDAVSGD